MTKTHWERSENLANMLIFCNPSSRKLKLFVIHCLEHSKQYLGREGSAKALKLLHLYADGKITGSKLERQIWKINRTDEIIRAYMSINRNYFDINYAVGLCNRAVNLVYYIPNPNYNFNNSKEHAWQRKLLRHMIKPNFKGG